MDERNEMQEDEWQPPVVPPVPPQGPGESGARPVRRKLIRPEREEPVNGRSGKDAKEKDAQESERSKRGYGRQQSRRSRMAGRSKDGQARENGRIYVRSMEQHEQTGAQNHDQYGQIHAQNQGQNGQVREESQERQGQTRAQNHGLHGHPLAPDKGRHGQVRVHGLDREAHARSQEQEEQGQVRSQEQEEQGQGRSQEQEEQGQARAQSQSQPGQARMQSHRDQPHAQNREQHDQVQVQSESRLEQARAQHQGQQGQARGRNREQRGQSESEQKQPIPASLDELKPMLEQEAGLNTSFDVVLREMTFGGRRTALFYMNGLVNSASLTEVLKRLSYLTSEDLDADALKLFFETYVPAIQVTKSETFDEVLDGVLAGNAAMFVDRERAALIIDAKMFPDRTPEEPSLERVVRGSRDGFVETLMTNVSLIRRRLRDKDLRYELIRVGARTKTDVCIAYIRDIADPELVEEVKRKIGHVNVYGLPLADKQLEETTVNLGWHPFPLVRYSERPDVVAAQLLEGSVAVLTDTTPSVMMLPTTYFDLTQHAEENRQTPFIGTYLRWVRYIGILFSLFLLPLWFLLVLRPELKPPQLDFLGPQQMGRIPLFLQFVLAEIGVDLMRMAAVHTPSPLSTAMSLIAAILIGDIAVKTGLFNNEVILYMAVAAIGMFATPNYELGLANRIVRLALIIAVAAFGVPGFVVGTALFVVLLACTRSFNRPYLWPFIPFDGRSLAALLVRPPELKNKKRNPLLKPQQLDRLPDSRENR